MPHDRHIPDEDLIRAIDGELDASRTHSVEAHVLHCWTCRARRAELERAIGDFVKVRQTEFAEPAGPQDGPSARLRATLAMHRQTSPSPARPFPRIAVALGCAAILATSATLMLWLTAQRASARPLPDSRLTPGATRLLSREEVCVVPVDDDGRAVPVELATQVFHQYRIERPRPRAYEVDYLISPALGGADDIRNLWPQPYAEGVWTSRVKDALEDHLRHLVCEGKLDLSTAQQDIATDWIAAYRKYFRTRRPLVAHTLFVKDRPWE